MNPTWSFVLAGIGVLGLWVAAKNPTVGWTINIVAQVLWVGYAIVTRQWGFIGASVAYAVVYARLLRRTLLTARDEKAAKIVDKIEPPVHVTVTARSMSLLGGLVRLGDDGYPVGRVVGIQRGWSVLTMTVMLYDEFMALTKGPGPYTLGQLDIRGEDWS